MDSKEFASALNSEENFEDSFDFDELEKKLQSQLKLELSELEILKENQKQIGDPDNLGKVVEDVIWEQVNNQIAIVAGEDFIKENGGMTLDLRNEAHIQTAENFAKGKIAKHNYKSREKLEKNYERYSNVPHKKFREEYVNPGMDKTLERAGELNKKGIDTVKDIYTGRQISTKTKLENGKNNPKSAQREHVKSSSELYKNPSLQMANDNEELAVIINDPENLQGYTTADRNNRKSDKTYDEMDSRDKNKHFEKANKKAEEFLEKKENEGEERLKKEGRQTQKEEAFRMGGKALRAVVMQLLASFVKEVIAKLIKWFKTTKGKFEMLLDSLKEAIHSFVGKLKTHLINAGSTLFNTIATMIIGPVYGILKKAWMLLKQGWKSIKEAIDYMKNPENKNQPLGRLILEISKIMTVGLTAAGAILLGEAIEKGLSSIPILLVEIPLLGSLANIIGIFMGAVVSGIIGAIAINLIQKMIKNKYETQIVGEKIDKSNEILRIQHKIINLNEDRVVETKERVVTNIKERHKNASDYIKDTFNKVFGEKNSTQEKMDEIDSLLEELMK
ncbi:hypothetical protein JMUB3936_1236 [Leptotrichia wadei]|uniref:Cation diffusion facilitator family transporter n=1 Tax=Leptotrichia wadei TaxID=157687 RepID=A0A510KTC6_9FUSO|nr:cation diffusion facilitator family transporter [Leptotrichia wadei]BBM54952.1 hypothetical protein JMUB3936_1236 [Leptotrichia wadei]